MTTSQVFVAYSHRDATVKDELVKQLQVALYGLSVDPWDDSRIGAGEQWRREIEAAVDRCAAALLLVSADSLTSKFILEDELPRLLQRRQRDGLPIFPVLVRSCPWKRVPWLEPLEIRPKDGQPLEGRADAASRMTDIANELAARLEPAAPRQAPQSVSPTTSSLPVAPEGPEVVPSGFLHQPAIQHNVIQNGVMCMNLLVGGGVQGAAGRHAQIAARFFFPDGRPLYANAREPWYRDSAGLVATHTQFPITQDPQNLSLVLTIPYYALNLAPTGMSMLYALTAQIDLYLDGGLALRSAHSPFSVYW
jgi:hypothetical protein